ncbi:DUF3349 domain-containing protein [Mycolicibacterium sp. CBM1]
MSTTLLTVTEGSLFHRVVDWLRAGYPTGVPGPDRVPLLALLRNTPLSEAEISDVVREISAAEAQAPSEHGVDRDEIAHFIAEHTQHDAGPENIKRVAAKLAAAGWPLAGVEETAVSE